MVLNWALGFSKQQKSVRGPPGVPGMALPGLVLERKGGSRKERILRLTPWRRGQGEFLKET